MSDNTIRIESFSNQTRQDKKLLKHFVDFHWNHYADDPFYVPLLDYEYLGFKLLNIRGFFEPNNLFFKHAEMRFFLAIGENEIVGRCNAFVNHRHTVTGKVRVGFLGNFDGTTI